MNVAFTNKNVRDNVSLARGKTLIILTKICQEKSYRNVEKKKEPFIAQVNEWLLNLELPRGIEPRTRRLQICCSTN